MKLTPRAEAAAELIIQTIAAFRAELAPLGTSLDVMIDGMRELKDTGTFAVLTIDRMVAAQKTLGSLPKIIKALEVIGPTSAIISSEMDLDL